MENVVQKLKNLFIPHEGNDHRPHILRFRAVATFCVFAFAAEAVFFIGISYFGPRSQLFGTIIVSSLTDGTNTARVADNLPSLQVSPVLQAAAQEKADDMVKNGYFAHTSPTGVTPWYWFEQVGYSFIYAGENLAVNFSDSQDVTNAWLNSPEHRANILNGNFTQIGIATAEGTYEGHDAIYVVELFGTPSAAPLALSTPALTGTQTQPASTPKSPTTVVTPKKPVKPTAAPVVVATSSLVTSSSNETFVAVKGASTQAAPLVLAPTTTIPAEALQTSQETAPADKPVTPETNLIQNLAANPRNALNDFYLFVGLFFAFALALNIFIKIRVQHPNVILGGVVAMSLAGIFFLLNQHLITGVVIK